MKKLSMFLTALLCVMAVSAKTVYLNVEAVLDEENNKTWASDGARFAAYTWNGDGDDATELTWTNLSLLSGTIYSADVPNSESIIFCRMDGTKTDNNWDNKWNQSQNLKLADGDYYIVKGWDNTGDWTTYSTGGDDDITPSDPELYVLGEVNGSGWDPSKAVKMDYADGKFTLKAEFAHFSFTTKLSSKSDDWYAIKSYRWAAEENEKSLADGKPATISQTNTENSFLLDGTYTLTVDWAARTVQAEKDLTVEDKFYVVGTESLFGDGNDWKLPGLLIEDGSVTIKDVPAGNHAFKVNRNGNWTVTYGYDELDKTCTTAATTRGEGTDNNNILFTTEEKQDVTIEFADGKICLKAKTATEPVVEPEKENGYYVVGQKALLGAEWAAAADNKMTVADGVATLVKTDLELAAGDYGYKVISVTDGTTTWIPDGMDNEYKLNIAEDGKYKVTFTYEIAKDAEGVKAVAEKTGDYTKPEPQPVTVEHLYILGEVNEQAWAPNAGVEMTKGENNTFSLKVNVKGYFSFTSMLSADADDWASIKDYRFVPDDLANDVTLADGVAAKLVSNYEDAPHAFTVAKGEYTITVDLSAMTVTAKLEGEVTPDPNPNPNPDPTTDTKVYVMGEIEANGSSPWAANIGTEMTYADGKYTLVANILGYFGFTTQLGADDKDWDAIAANRLGAAEADTEVSTGAEYTMTSGSDQSWKIATAGVYTITVDLTAMTFSLAEGGTLPPDNDALDNVYVTLDMNAPMFNTLGQRVNQDYKGIVIQNGKKFLLK